MARDNGAEVAVGECPEHGYVSEHDDEMTWNPPEPAECQCGEKLTRVTMTTVAAVKQAKNDSA